MTVAEQELAYAVSIAREAAETVLDYFSSDRIKAQVKGERDVVTAADFASEKLIRKRIAERFPGDGVVGEEGSDTQLESSRRWYVDPLDGTLNYSRQLPVWSVSMALFENDRPILGVIVDPIRNETFAAAVGLGATLNGRTIQCSSTHRPQDAFVHITVDFNEQSMTAGLKDIAVVAPRVLRTRNIGSAALALAYVACGRFDAMFHRFANAWDYGAGVILVEEAGGQVTDMEGRQYRSGTRALVAAAGGALHAGLLPLVQSGKNVQIE